MAEQQFAVVQCSAPQESEEGSKPACERVADTQELLVEILANLPPRKIFQLVQSVNHFRQALHNSLRLEILTLGARLPSLQQRFNDIVHDLNKEDAEVILVDQILPFHRLGREHEVDLSVLAMPTTEKSATAKSIFFEQLESNALEPTQADAQQFIKLRFPTKARFPFRLELAVVTQKMADKENRQVVWRVSCALAPVSLGELSFVIDVLRKAAPLPHRRRSGLLSVGSFDTGEDEWKVAALGCVDGDVAIVREEWKL